MIRRRNSAALAPVLTVGAVCTVVSELVSTALLPLLVLPSFTCQLIVRLVWPPPAVGSPLAVTLYCTCSRTES